MLIFKTALTEGYVPSYWKISEVISIFMDENRALIEQYRFLSLLCNLSKVLEKLIFDKLYDIVKTKIKESQQGFRRHRSVIAQLLLFLELLYNDLDEKENELFVLYLDFEEAFDSVPYELLLQKLKDVGVGGSFLKIMQVIRS